MGTRPFVALALVLASCGSPSRGGYPAASGGSFEARFILAQPLAHGHFDARSPRAQKVDGQLTAMLGHPLVFYFDAALVPKWEDDFEALSISALEDVAQRLTTLKRIEPAMFAWAAPRLTRVEWNFDATKEHEEAAFDPSSGKLRLQLTPESSAILGEHQLEWAIGRAWGKELASRFASSSPQSIGRDDDDRYFEWLTDYGYSYERDRAPPRGIDDTLDTPHASQILRVLAYEAALAGKNAPIEKRVRAWIVEQGEYLRERRSSNADAVAALPASHPFLQAERGWAAWAAQTIDSLTDAQQNAVIGAIAEGREREGGAAAFPGFDDVAYALRLADRWRAAGHPSTRGSDDEKNPDRDRLLFGVLGTLDFPPDERTGCRSTAPLLYKDAATDPKAQARLFDDAFGKKDVPWEKVVLVNLLATESLPPVMAFWQRSEGDETAFHAATRVLAGQVDGCSFARDAVFDRLPALWHAHPQPKPRGVLLFLLARYGGELVGWDHFDHLFEAKLTKAEVSAYLDEDVEPFNHLHFMWPAFGAGWSHADVILPRLDGWLTDDFRRFNMWTQEMVTLANDFCSDKAPAESAKFHAWLEARARAHPSESQQLEPALEIAKPGGCKG